MHACTTARADVRTHVHTRDRQTANQTYMHACTPTRPHAHTYARTHARTHTQIYIDTYERTSERTDGRTDRQTLRQTYTYTPFLFLSSYF